jgi:hypothetical protein
MSKDAPYTVTVYVAAPGTPLAGGGTSAAGHMYLSVEHGDWSRSYGFAPIEHGATSGPGAITYRDSQNYQNPYYARTMEITKQLEKRRRFRAPQSFSCVHTGERNQIKSQWLS